MGLFDKPKTDAEMRQMIRNYEANIRNGFTPKQAFDDMRRDLEKRG